MCPRCGNRIIASAYGNELHATKLPPLVRPIESSAVPSSIMYVNKGILVSNDLTIPFFPLAFGSFSAGIRKAIRRRQTLLPPSSGTETQEVFAGALAECASGFR